MSRHRNIRLSTLSLTLGLTLFLYADSAFCLKSDQECPKYINPTHPEFPILAYTSFRDSMTISRENFRILREAGFNISMTHVADTALTNMTLRAAEGSGVKIMVNCTETRDDHKMKWSIPFYKDNPGVMGYFITDEPKSPTFRKWAKKRDIIFEYDTIHLPYVNLLPMALEYTEPDAYEKYVRDFVDIVNLPMISYDNYPISRKNGKIKIKDSFFQNLEIIAKVSEDTGRPFWAFCMSTPHYDYPEPTVGHLLFEAFNALAYGAQGINYYGYNIFRTHAIKYYSAPIDSSGNKTPIWNRVRDVNRQIHNLSHIFLNAKRIGTWHTGEKIPRGTTRLKKMPHPFKSIKTGKQGVLVSHLENNGQQYLIIVNHDVEKRQSISLSTTEEVRRVFPDGSIKPFISSAFSLNPGGYAIFTFD